MHRMRIYLDTSVINYLDAPAHSDKMSDTQDLWEILKRGEFFEAVISGVTEQEVDACPEPKRSFMFQKLTEIPFAIIEVTHEITDLAEEYIKQGVLSRTHYNDLLHIAHAVVGGCSCIVSWNFRHFVNIKTIDRVNAANLTNGYQQIKIVPPSMIRDAGEQDE